MEYYPLRACFQIFDAAFGFQNFVDVPRNGFALAVGVGGQIQCVRLLHRRHNCVYVFFAFGGDFVFHRKIMFWIDRAVFRHQIAHMAERSQHFKTAAKIFFDGFDFVGRFYNQ